MFLGSALHPPFSSPMKHHVFSGSNDGLNIVAVGGGTGLATLLSGLKAYVDEQARADVRIGQLSAIVAVTDDGGSSGRLRDELQMLPPGDIRNCIVALSEDSQLLSRLFRHRFRGEGDLGGHSFGNLFLAALSEITGDFAEAVKLSSEILASKGHIYPATVSDVRLAAQLDDGTTIKGETNIGRNGRSIKRLVLEPSDCKPLEQAVDAILRADVITVGPGSLFTSLLPPLLVEGIAEAITRSAALKLFVCNLMTQPGETDGFSALKHLEVMKEHVPQLEFDEFIVNDTQITETQLANYAEEGAVQLRFTGHDAERYLGRAEAVRADLLADGEMVRHDPDKLARVLLDRAFRFRSELVVLAGR
jgi:uncharacterized cofD-like protein